MKENYRSFFEELEGKAGINGAAGVYNGYEYNAWISPEENENGGTVNIFFNSYIEPSKYSDLLKTITTNSPINVTFDRTRTGFVLHITGYLLDDILVELKGVFECVTEALLAYGCKTYEYCPICGKRIEHSECPPQEILDNYNYPTLFANICSSCRAKANSQATAAGKTKAVLLTILETLLYSIFGFGIFFLVLIPKMSSNAIRIVELVSYFILIFNITFYLRRFIKRRYSIQLIDILIGELICLFITLVFTTLSYFLTFGIMAQINGWGSSNYFETFRYIINETEFGESFYFELGLLIFIYAFDFGVRYFNIHRFQRQKGINR